MSANPVANPGVTPEPAPAPAQGTPTPATPQEAPAEAPVKTFFSKKAKAEESKESLPDISKLPPEMQNVYKSMQADATKKWQEIADQRKTWEAERATEQATLKAEREAFQRSQEAILEAIRGRSNPQDAAAPTDIKAQIAALRAEGRYDEADQVMLDAVKQAAMQEVAPIKREAETQKLQSTFQATAINVVASNPVVAEYKDEVVKIFDAPTPVMQKLRSVALASPENVQTFVPMILNAIATEIHAQRMEAQATSLRTELDSLKSKASATKARSIPARLVTSGGTSRETTGSGGGLASALARAETALRGA
jgi:hypothetical protein